VKIKIIIVLSVFSLDCWLSTAMAQDIAGNEIEEIEANEVDTKIESSTLRQYLWPIHALLAGLCTVQLIASMIIARRRSRDKFWLAKHKTLGLVSPPLILIAIGVAYTMVGIFEASHFSIPHTWIGLAAGSLTLGLPLLGFSMFWSPKKRKVLRILHVWLGRLALLFLVVGCISGLFFAYT
jgi:predicted permease